MQRPAYKSHLIAMLALLAAFNAVDRLALGVLLQDIKVDLGLSDSQLGFVTGIAFSIFYAVLGIPIARWADRGNRVFIISVTALLSGAAIALCGVVTTFVQFLLVRVLVAAGEAGFQPPAVSLIADQFERAERQRAIARFTLGGPLALTLGYFAAGWFNHVHGWRATFVTIGIVGIVLAMIAGWTLRDPRSVRSDAQPMMAGPARPHPKLTEVFSTLWKVTAFRHLLLCFSVWCFFGGGILQWQPAFFIRSHGLDTATLGTWFALIYGVGGALGTYVSGELAARYAARNERLLLIAIAWLFVVFAAFTACAYLTDDLSFAIAFLAISATGGAMANGPLTAVTQAVVPANMRATAIAVVYLFANLVGLGLGPLVVGALSDVLRPTLGEESLRYALLACCPGYVWAAFHAWRAGKTVVISERAIGELAEIETQAHSESSPYARVRVGTRQG